MLRPPFIREALIRHTKVILQDRQAPGSYRLRDLLAISTWLITWSV